MATSAAAYQDFWARPPGRDPAIPWSVRGLAHETLGEFDAARADYEAALRTADLAGDRPAEWEARIQLGMVWASRDYSRAGEHLRGALALAQAIGDPGWALRMVDDLLATVEPIHGDRRVPRLLRIRGSALAALGRLDDGRAELEAAQAACVARGQRSLLWRVLLSLATVNRAAADLAAAGAAGRAAGHLVEVLAADVPSRKLRAAFRARAPMKREARPEEIAFGVLFLACEEASFVTGAELAIDGGYTCV
jgi:tetratricopeptide (TPR) repeat protein